MGRCVGFVSGDWAGDWVCLAIAVTWLPVVFEGGCHFVDFIERVLADAGGPRMADAFSGHG